VLCQHRIEHLAHKALAGLGQLEIASICCSSLEAGPLLLRAGCLPWPNNSSSDTDSVSATVGSAEIRYTTVTQVAL
jgi:hypothetical protein